MDIGFIKLTKSYNGVTIWFNINQIVSFEDGLIQTVQDQSATAVRENANQIKNLILKAAYIGKTFTEEDESENERTEDYLAARKNKE